MTETFRPELTVVVDAHRYELTGHDELTFGRDANCTVQIGSDDSGVSRFAGRIHGESGHWCISNLSRKRPLHIADGNGFTVPLPVDKPGWPVARRLVDQPRLTVLVAGNKWTYALELTVMGGLVADAPQAAESPVSTVAPVLRMTDKRREVLVALTEGYLQPGSRYDPRPAGYDAVATRLGLSGAQVRRRIEDIRAQLTAAGVQGLDGARDTRSELCEWLLSMRLVTPQDLDWLANRLGARQGTPPLVEPPVEPTTSQFARSDRIVVTYEAHRAARVMAGSLEQRLRREHGDGWLAEVNAYRRINNNLSPGSSLDDDRFCLWLVARYPRIQRWAGPSVAARAGALKSLADTAAHGRPLPPDAAAMAGEHADVLTYWARSAPADLPPDPQ